jgi:hypothetical protein
VRFPFLGLVPWLLVTGVALAGNRRINYRYWYVDLWSGIVDWRSQLKTQYIFDSVTRQLSVRDRHSVLVLFIGDVDRLKDSARLAWDEAGKVR